MELNLIDFHSDTPAELRRKGMSLGENTAHVSLNRAARYRHYTEVFAVFNAKQYTEEEGWERYHRVREYFAKELESEKTRISSVTTAGEMQRAWEEGKTAAFHAVEDARILNGKLERLDHLYEMGVRFLTLTWKDVTCIGGAWNTHVGLTDFGKEVVKKCFALGIIPDVSHASKESIDDVILLAFEAGKPFIATHSNSYQVYPHARNLRDGHFEALKALGGVIGTNLYTGHLTDTKLSPATPETVLRHTDHFLSLGGEDQLVFGCDFDGADLPEAITGVDDVSILAEVFLQHNYPEALVRKIFWENAEAFLKKNLG